MTIEELCEKTDLFKVDFILDYDNYWVPGGWYRTGIDMSHSAIWNIPTDRVNKQYAIVYKNKGKFSILTDIEFIGDKCAIVEGHYANYNTDNPRLIELIEKAKKLLDGYSIYDKQYRIEKELDKVGVDFK